MRISVIMPTKNSEATIQRALDSVKRQEYKDYELLIADGGSTDNTLKIIKDNGFKVASKKDSSSSEGVRKITELATGSIMTLLMSDDELGKECMQKAISKLEETKADWVYGKMEVRKPSGITYMAQEPITLKDLLNGKGFPTGGTFFKKELYKKVGGLDKTLHYAVDIDLWIKMFKESTPEYIKDTMYIFYVTGRNQSINNQDKVNEEGMRVLERHRENVVE